MRAISATRAVEVEPDRAFDVLSDLDNHWRIAGRFVEVLSLEGPVGARDGGSLRVHGPLGLRRTVRTAIVERRAPEAIVGAADAGRRTSARVAWRLRPDPAGTLVDLEVTVLRAGWPDRVLLGAGGRWWLRRRLLVALEHFAELVAREAPAAREAAITSRLHPVPSPAPAD